MDCCISLATNIGEKVVFPFICKHLLFVVRCKKDVDILNTDIVPNLEAELTRVQVFADQARRNVEEVHENVKTLLEKAANVSKAAKGLAQKFGGGGEDGEDGDATRSSSRCRGIGFVPSLASRRRIGRDACNLAEEANKLLTDLKKITSQKQVSYHPYRPDALVENRGYEAFDSRTKLLNGIKEALRDDQVTMIGVYGMPGIGKTTLAKEIKNDSSKDDKFTSVIFVTVSQVQNHGKTQKVIAEQLGMTVSDSESVSAKADRIRERLRQEKFLVILDDVWSRLNLDDVGIPNCSDGHSEGCKIMLTSRFRTVLNTMNAAKVFQVGALSDSEALHLFNKTAGEVAKRPDFESVATKIVMECAGLPIALESLASTLRNQGLPIWKDALTRLQRSILTDIEDMNEKVYVSVRMTYDLLGDEDAKELFLLCCLREEDENIGMYYTFIYGIGWGLFKNCYTLEEAIHRAHALYEKLKAHCLLLEGDYYWSVKMHDVVRDVGMHIAAKDRRMYNIKSDIELENHLKEAVLKESTAISLLYNDQKFLPERLDCPQLRLIWLWKTGYRSTHDLFFHGTKELRVLDLSYTHFNQLPSSFRALANLHTLVFCGSYLGDIRMIGELKTLEFLEMEQSNIVQLPEEIGKLTRLRSLGLYKCSKLTTIPPNVISKLTRLEELNMLYTPNVQWEVEGSNERKNASLAELRYLERLKALHIDISSTKVLPKGFFSEELERCEIVIDNKDSPCNWYGSKLSTHFLCGTKMLKLYLKDSCLVQEYDLGRFLEICDEIQLFGLEGANSLVGEINRSGFQRLKHLAFQHNNSIRCLAGYSNQEDGIRSYSTNTAFQRLESLRLWQINKLEQIVQGEFSPVSFANLREIEVKHCGSLKNLFPLHVAKHLQQLGSINLKDCKMMDAIFDAVGTGQSSRRADRNDDHQSSLLFPRLSYMSLQDLPLIVSQFSSESERTNRPFFSGKVQLGIRICLQSLTELYVWECNCLKYLFSASVAANLPKLGLLDIRQCIMMEEIIITEVEDQKIERILFPQLHSLTLAYLPNLRTYCTGTSVEFPLLANSNIRGCPQFRP